MKLVLDSRLLFFLLAFCVSFSQYVENLTEFQAKVVGIKDGDTYSILYHKKEHSIRLEHIDCPEGGQPFGKNAKRYASTICFDSTVLVKLTGKKDRFGRLIGELYLDDKCINKEMVRAGFAWHFIKYSKDYSYSELEEQARKAKLGLWTDPNAIPPWEWRKKKRGH